MPYQALLALIRHGLTWLGGWMLARGFFPDEATAALRSHNVPPELRAQLAIDLAARLGATFRVLHEAVGTPNEHFHVELRPARV